MSLQGIFEIKRLVDGQVTATEVFENLITQSGLELLSAGVGMNQLRIGKGTAQPVKTSTGVTGEAFGEHGILQLKDYTFTEVNDPTGPYIEHVYHATIEAGHVLKGWSDLSVGRFIANKFTCLNHALVKNATGTPIAIDKLRDEVIEVTYRLRIYSIVNPVTIGTLNIGGVEHTVRCTSAQTKSAIALDGVRENPKNFIGYVGVAESNSIPTWAAVDSSVAVTDYNVEKRDYVAASHKHHVDLTFVAPVDKTKVIGRIRLDHPFGAMNYLFTPAITLPSRQILQLGLDYVWSEGTNNT